MTQLRITLLTALIQMLLLPSALAWPITTFKVHFGEPWHSQNDYEVFLGRAYEDILPLDGNDDRPSHISQATVDEIERYLGEVALWYESMGFINPTLEPQVETENGERAYLIYLFDMAQGEPPAKYWSDCYGGALRRFIGVDMVHAEASATIDANGNITDKGYQDLAHELFHAVQATYPLVLGSCTLGDWIGEGTAQAMGIEAARVLRDINQPQDPGRWGLRRYYSALRVADDVTGELSQDAYKSSSFWHYLGEKVALNGGNPSGDFVSPDMSYLNDFFRTHIAGGISETSELNWISERLHKHDAIGQKLNRIYPNFITTFASYLGNRITPSATNTGDIGRARWLGKTFEECPKVIVEINQPPEAIQVQLDRVAARCWIVATDLEGPVAIQVTARNAPPAQLAQLSVGTHEGVTVAKPKIVNVAGQKLAQWLFRIEGGAGQESVFVISNVAEIAGNTVPVKATVELAVSGWTSNMVLSQ